MRSSILRGIGIVALIGGSLSAISEEPSEVIVPCQTVKYGPSVESQKSGQKRIGAILAGTTGVLSYRFLVIPSSEEKALRENKKLAAAIVEFSDNEKRIQSEREKSQRILEEKRAFIQKHNLTQVSDAVKRSQEPLGPTGLPKGIDPVELFKGTSVSESEKSKFLRLVSQDISALSDRLTFERQRERLLNVIKQLSQREIPVGQGLDQEAKVKSIVKGIQDYVETREKSLRGMAKTARVKRIAMGVTSLAAFGLGIYLFVDADDSVASTVDKSNEPGDSYLESLAETLRCTGDYIRRLEEPYIDDEHLRQFR